MHRDGWMFAVIASMALPIWGAPEPQRAETEQTHFRAVDVSVKKPTPIPKEIQDLLIKDESVHEVLDSESPAFKTLPTSWFSASVVHLGSPSEKDMVLVGRGPMQGSNVTQYWLFRKKGSGYVKVLSAHALDLILLDKRWNGLREVELLSATGVKIHTVILRFDGKQYAVISDNWEPIK
jgi:hypothetical protein